MSGGGGLSRGEAVTGRMKGRVLAEIPSRQMSLAQWLSLYPNSMIMQADTLFADRYPTTYAYETGESRSASVSPCLIVPLL